MLFWKKFVLASMMVVAPTQGQDEIDLPPTTPGFDLLGIGYDQLIGNPLSTEGTDGGYREEIFNFTFNDGRATQDRRYLIPDKTSSRLLPACSSEMTTTTFASTSRYYDLVSRNVDVNLPLPGGVSFTLSTSYEDVRNSTDEREEIYIHASATCTVYQLAMMTFDLPDFNDNFRNGVERMPEVYDENYMFTFLSSFGTDYIRQFDAGGRFGRSVSYTRSSYQNILDSELNIDTGVSATIFGSGLTVTSNTTRAMQRAFTDLQTTVTNRSFSIGGSFTQDPDGRPLITPPSEFLGNVLEFGPVPVRGLRLLPISSLLTTTNFPGMGIKDKIGALQANVKNATANWCEIRKQRAPKGKPVTCTPPTDQAFPVPMPPVAHSVRRICVRNQAANTLRWELRYARCPFDGGKNCLRCPFDGCNFCCNSGNYRRGTTRCLDLRDTATVRGAEVSLRAYSIESIPEGFAGKRVGTVLLDRRRTRPVPVYDERSNMELHVVCTGTRRQPVCTSIGLRRLFTPVEASNLCAPSRNEATFQRVVLDGNNAQAPVGFQGAVAGTVEVQRTIDPNDPLGLTPVEGTENDVMMMVDIKHQVGEMCAMQNKMFKGQQYKLKATDEAECYVQCQLNEGIPEGKDCAGWTYMKDSKEACRLFLKTKFTEEVPGVVSGKRNCDPNFGVTRAPNGEMLPASTGLAVPPIRSEAIERNRRGSEPKRSRKNSGGRWSRKNSGGRRSRKNSGGRWFSGSSSRRNPGWLDEIVHGEAYNCFTKEVWSADKQEWCCKFQGMGCTGEAYNCFTKEVWSADKQEWCCKFQGMGCPADDCDPSLMCGEALTCVDGELYPTTCGPTNCDKPIGPCKDDAKDCDSSMICGQALTCVGEKLYPTTCGPENCDKPIGPCKDDAKDCDSSLLCGEALTCVGGELYPTTCGPENCDKPIGPCKEADSCADVVCPAVVCLDGSEPPKRDGECCGDLKLCPDEAPTAA